MYRYLNHGLVFIRSISIFYSVKLLHLIYHTYYIVPHQFSKIYMQSLIFFFLNKNTTILSIKLLNLSAMWQQTVGGYKRDIKFRNRRFSSEFRGL